MGTFTVRIASGDRIRVYPDYTAWNATQGRIATSEELTAALDVPATDTLARIPAYRTI
jgi:hypothetical protein